MHGPGRKKFSRRICLQIGGYAVGAASLGRGASANVGLVRRPGIVLFDGFPIFDPRAIGKMVEARIPDRAKELNDLWRTTVFEHQWLRALGASYLDFERIVADALDYASGSLDIRLAKGDREYLASAYFTLRAWPDVEPALVQLRSMGLKIAFLSNMTERMLRTNMNNSKLNGLFDAVISTDAIKSFKPDPRAYALACQELRVSNLDEILFVPSAAWDCAGAKWFGLHTYWVNRLKALSMPGIKADGEGQDLDALAQFVRALPS